MQRNILLVFLVSLFFLGCASQSTVMIDGANEAGPVAFTLQLLHFADVDGNEETALASIDEFSALVNVFKNDPDLGASTLLVSSGDNIIPGPRFYAAEQGAVRSFTGSNEPGHIDVAFLNALGVSASAVGNHELDAGPGEFVDALSSEERNGVVFPGSLFPYLSANLDFSTEGDFEGLIGEDGMMADQLAGKVAASAVVTVNGEKIGLVGASTPLLDTITTTGGITVNPSSRSVEELASIIQAAVDQITAKGINKVILLAHMQQIDIEKELAALLSDVDIIVAGGSNTRMGDTTDLLFSADDSFDEFYPFGTKDKDNNPIFIVNVDGDYKYLGRFVVGFDSNGIINIDSFDYDKNGAWASTAENIAILGAEPMEEVVALRDTVQSVITAQFGNVVGYTSVYLDGRRGQVRTEETNLGNLSADANLWYANQLSTVPVDVSLKNGGGIRTEIGAAVVPPGSVDYSEAMLVPPRANSETGTAEGAITEGHLRATLRFDNGLATMDVTATELKLLLEHGVSRSGPGITPGQFPQVGGMQFSFDINAEAGSRIESLEIIDETGSVKDVVVENGAIVGDANRVFRLVTLNFLANGGDAYPFDQLSNPQRRNLYEGAGFGEDIDYDDEDLSKDPGLNSSFSYTGGEQDALAEYLLAYHGSEETAFNKGETEQSMDMRIMY